MSDVLDPNVALKELSQWRGIDGRAAIQRKFRFKDFSTAWGFLTQVAILAASRNQYPELINNCERVTVILSAGELGAFVEADVEMAKAIDAILPPPPAPVNKTKAKTSSSRTR